MTFKFSISVCEFQPGYVLRGFSQTTYYLDKDELRGLQKEITKAIGPETGGKS